MQISILKMNKRLYTLAACLFFVAVLCAQADKPTPYKANYTIEKPNKVGVYPTIKNVPTWDGLLPGSYSLKFKINGLQKNDTVYLADNYNGSKYLRDTAVVDKKGIANFTGNHRLQRGMYLFVFPKKQGYFEFLVGDNQDFLIEADTSYYESDYYAKFKTANSPENAAFASYQKDKVKFATQIMEIDQKLKAEGISEEETKDLNKKRDELYAEKTNIDKNYIAKNPDHLLSRFLQAMMEIEVPKEIPMGKDGKPDSGFQYRYYRDHFFDNIDFAEDGLMRMPIHIVKQKLDYYWDKVQIMEPDTAYNNAKKIIAKAANTVDLERYLIWYHINKFETSNLMGMDKAFVNLAKETYMVGKAWWADSATAANISKNVIEREGSLLGKKGADLMLMTSNQDIITKTGSPWVRLYDYKAKYKFLIFWDPTCGHCKEVVPKLAKLYNNNINENWLVFGLIQKDKEKEFGEFMKEHPEVQGWIHLDRSTVPTEQYAENLKKYYVIASPTIFILDEDNTIIANRMDVEKIPEFLENYEKLQEILKKNQL